VPRAAWHAYMRLRVCNFQTALDFAGFQQSRELKSKSLSSRARASRGADFAGCDSPQNALSHSKIIRTPPTPKRRQRRGGLTPPTPKPALEQGRATDLLLLVRGRQPPSRERPCLPMPWSMCRHTARPCHTAALEHGQTGPVTRLPRSMAWSIPRLRRLRGLRRAGGAAKPSVAQFPSRGLTQERERA
jgi:hypothetical protein